jgi:hypothetical protein
MRPHELEPADLLQYAPDPQSIESDPFLNGAFYPADGTKIW